MRNKIFGGIGIVWGGGILAMRLFGEPSGGSEAYQSGQTGAAIFGLIMLVLGFYYYFKK